MRVLLSVAACCAVLVALAPSHADAGMLQDLVDARTGAQTWTDSQTGIADPGQPIEGAGVGEAAIFDVDGVVSFGYEFSHQSVKASDPNARFEYGGVLKVAGPLDDYSGRKYSNQPLVVSGQVIDRQVSAGDAINFGAYTATFVVLDKNYDLTTQFKITDFTFTPAVHAPEPASIVLLLMGGLGFLGLRIGRRR